MRHISIDLVEPGNQLGKSIYSKEGRTLIQSGVHLTPGMINQLRRIGVTMIYIQDKQFEDVKIEDVVSDETRREAIANVSDVIQCVQEGKDVNLKSVNKSITNIIDEILKNSDVLIHLTDIRTKDNQLFIHSLNVCIMAVIIGVNLGYNTAQLKELGLGALLHDIGKVAKDNDPLKELFDKNLMNDHSWIGFNILRKKHELSLPSAHIALQHHEFVDGTGSPRGIHGSEIHPYAKIVAVVNNYDNLISPLAVSTPLLPYEAIEHIMGLAGKQFDHDIVNKFLRSIAFYPTGTSVRLDTGEVGVVVGQHKGLPTRPIVRIISKNSSQGNYSYDEPEVKEIDLAKETTIFIKEVLKT